MMTPSFLGRATLLTVVLLAGLPLALYAGSPTAVTMNIFAKVVDEQPTGCPAYPPLTPPWVFDFVGYKGDLSNGPTSAYGFGAPWTLYPSSSFDTLSSAAYVHGADCNASTGVCLGVKFNHNERTLSLDTRGTAGPRKTKIDFSVPCATCGYPNKALLFSNPVTTPMLISVFLDHPFTSMEVCTTTACAEAEPAFVKLWFDDPAGDPLLSYRVEWGHVRVLRMSADAWYVIADGCDGSQVATLSMIHNNQKRPSVRLQGYYLMPFFLSAVR